MAADEGGKGGTSALPQTSDTRLLERALRERWKIPDHIRAALPAAMGVILLSKDTSNRNKIAAARALISADDSNVKAEAAAEITELRDEVAALRRELQGGQGDGGAGEPETGRADASGGGPEPSPDAGPEPIPGAPD